jgi:hypothetical protein
LLSLKYLPRLISATAWYKTENPYPALQQAAEKDVQYCSHLLVSVRLNVPTLNAVALFREYARNKRSSFLRALAGFRLAMVKLHPRQIQLNTSLELVDEMGLIEALRTSVDIRGMNSPK